MLYKSKLDSSKLTMTAFSFLLYTPLQEYTQVGSKLYLRIRLIKKDLLLIRNTHLLLVNSLSGILNDIRVWTQTRAKALLNRDYIIKSLVSVRGMSEESAKQFIEDQTKNFTNTTEDFAKIVGRNV